MTKQEYDQIAASYHLYLKNIESRKDSIIESHIIPYNENIKPKEKIWEIVLLKKGNKYTYSMYNDDNKIISYVLERYWMDNAKSRWIILSPE